MSGDDPPANLGGVALDPELARQLTAAGHKTEEWRARRDRLIFEAAQQGGSLREIAALVGLSNPGVLRVIRRLESGSGGHPEFDEESSDHPTGS